MLPSSGHFSFLAVIDLGKSRSKVSILTPEGQIVDSLNAPAAQTGHLHDGIVDIDRLGAWCENALCELYRRHAFDGLIAVAHGATVVTLDASGATLPVADYETPIAAPCAAAYDALRPAFAETGSPSLPLGLNLGRQLYAQELQPPASHGGAAVFLTYPQYWTWRWCGALGTDVSSLGCHTDLWQAQRGSWSTLASARGWDQRFPALVGAGKRAGQLRATLARRIGATRPITVYWGVHDSNAALAAFLGAREPFTLISTGTWTVVFAVGGAATELPERRDTLWNADINGRPVASARFMAGREREAIAGSAPAVASSALKQVLDSDLIAMPAFAPGGPFPGRRGRIDGTTPLHDSGRAALAALYNALTLDTMLDLVGARGQLIVEGPLAGDAAALAALAALRPQQVVRSTQINCVAHGAARLVFGAEQLPPPPAQLTPPEIALIHPINAHRQRWRRALDETRP